MWWLGSRLFSYHLADGPRRTRILRRLIQIDGVILTDRFANAAFLLFEVKTAFVDVRDQGNGLSEIDVDGFVLRYLLIKLIRVFGRAVFDAGRTARAFAL